jgi:hypothetical protein
MLTVITPAATQRLVTLESVRRELDLRDDGDDVLLAALIDQASDAVRGWCSRSFALETVSETFRLRRVTDSLLLARWPVVSVASITHDGSALTAADYEMELDRGIVYRLDGADSRDCWRPGKIVVQYDAGYILPDAANRTLPQAIERATIALVKAAWFARQRDPMVREEDVRDILDTTYWPRTGALPADVEGLLSAYRQPHL